MYVCPMLICQRREMNKMQSGKIGRQTPCRCRKIRYADLIDLGDEEKIENGCKAHA